jgi:hypothetical protein
MSHNFDWSITTVLTSQSLKNIRQIQARNLPLTMRVQKRPCYSSEQVKFSRSHFKFPSLTWTANVSFPVQCRECNTIFNILITLISLESRECGRRDPSRWPLGTFYLRKLTLISPTSGGRSVGIVCLQTQATEFSLVLIFIIFIFYSVFLIVCRFGVLCFVWAWCVILCDKLQIQRSGFDSRRYQIF